MAQNKVWFSVDTQLLDELGKRLVTNDHIALAELVKNSYDADSDWVEIQFHDRPDGTDILIRDSGEGMTYAQILTSWMRVATTEKIENNVSARYGRPKTGSKGIGRFAVLRLSHALELTARGRLRDGSIEETRITFDWERLKPGQALDSLAFTAHTSKSRSGQPGLELLLTDTRRKWTKTDINNLKKDLSEVVLAPKTRRAGFGADPGFEIRIKQGDSRPVTLSDEFLDSGWCRMKGAWSAKSRKWQLKIDGKHLKEGTHFEQPVPESLSSVKESLRLDVCWFPQKAGLWRNRSIATHETITSLLSEASGVRVYFNQNRIFPYGNPGDDWLGLEHIQASRVTKIASPELEHLAASLAVIDHRPILDSPRPQRLIGKIFITQPPRGPLIPTTDRMGFTENAAFADLRQLVQSSIQWMTIHYSYAKLRASEDRAERRPRSHSADPHIARTFVYQLKEALDNGESDVVVSADEGSQLIETAEAVALRVEKQTTHSELLEHLASASSILFAFTHEVHASIRTLGRAATELESANAPAVTKRQISETADSMRELLSLVSNLARDARTTKLTPQAVAPAVERAFRAFASIAKQFEVEFEMSVKEGLVTPRMHPAALSSILLNLVSNALKAVLAVSGARRIRVDAQAAAGFCRISVLDTGIGLPGHLKEVVFEPLTSDPANNLYSALALHNKSGELEAISAGMGLGLSIVRSVTSRAAGTVNFAPTSKPWSTLVEVHLPYEDK